MELGLYNFTELLSLLPGMSFDERLVRSFFKQLVYGVEFLHKNGVAHLDLKLSNLVIGEDYTLKIIDFDQSFMTGDLKLRGRGTLNFRSPELQNGNCQDPFKADIFSIAIILFCLRFGKLPFNEEKLIKGKNLEECLFLEPSQFWKFHGETYGVTLGEDFKTLFEGMTQPNPDKRFTIDQIKESQWFKSEVYSDKWLRTKLKTVLDPDFDEILGRKDKSPIA
jgi:[calcium/calmodulin-dependent protein kinase] kinase